MKARFILPLALLLVCTGAALAKTPDDAPPSSETVCDMEQGAAYGLCNAYCEAMDCESANPSASATACAKVRSKFQQVTGRDLPCEVSCPCADVEGGFATFLAGGGFIEACVRGAEGSIAIRDADTHTSALSVDVEGQWICGLVELSEGFLPISPEQGQYCAQLLEQEANRRGFTCTSPE